jgi:hypothetical protein
MIYNPDGSIHLEIDNPVSWSMEKEAPTLLRVTIKDESGQRKFIRTTLPFILERWGEE